MNHKTLNQPSALFAAGHTQCCVFGQGRLVVKQLYPVPFDVPDDVRMAIGLLFFPPQRHHIFL